MEKIKDTTNIKLSDKFAIECERAIEKYFTIVFIVNKQNP